MLTLAPTVALLLARLMASGAPAGPGAAPSPSPSPSPTFPSLLETAEQECQSGDSSLCSWVAQATGSRTAGLFVEAFVGTPLRILGIVAVAFLVRFVLHRVIHRVTERVATGNMGASKLDERLPSASAIYASSPLASDRRAQRARTLGSVLRSITTGVIGMIAVFMVLDELNFNVAPLLAGAGIVGVALGFGAQSLVKDFLSGAFMIIEDQYGVGDMVDVGDAVGTVEAVGLRVTRLRDADGAVWYVRNGEIVRVANRSQGWARAVLDVSIAYTEDTDRVRDLMLDVARELSEDEDFSSRILDEPAAWGIESMQPEGVVVRLIVKTQPLQQWDIARELRRRVKVRFEVEGVEIPLQQRALLTDVNPSRAAGSSGAKPAS